MAKKAETKFSERLCKVLESQCAFIINMHGHLFQRSGIPDLQILHRRWDGFLELKVGENKPSDLQEKVAKKIQDRGTSCYVFREVITNDLLGKISYQLEDFQGKIITKVNSLDKLLDVLVGLCSIKTNERIISWE